MAEWADECPHARPPLAGCGRRSPLAGDRVLLASCAPASTRRPADRAARRERPRPSVSAGPPVTVPGLSTAVPSPTAAAEPPGGRLRTDTAHSEPTPTSSRTGGPSRRPRRSRRVDEPVRRHPHRRRPAPANPHRAGADQRRQGRRHRPRAQRRQRREPEHHQRAGGRRVRRDQALQHHRHRDQRRLPGARVHLGRRERPAGRCSRPRASPW